jgi:hypothetical protein
MRLTDRTRKENAPFWDAEHRSSTPDKPSMKNTEPQELYDDASQESTWSSAAKLSRKVRELAHRSSRALKAGAQQPDYQNQAGSTDVVHDLGDLNDQVARLQQKIHARRLGALIPWVDALKQRVHDRLNIARKAGAQCEAQPPKSAE